MASITIRNIPDEIFKKIKHLSSIEKRSLNSEFLVIIEKGLHSEINEIQMSKKNIPRSIQVNLWENLSGEWEDSRTTEEIKQDIYIHRTLGREIDL